MVEIWSKVAPEMLLHMVYRASEIESGRTELVNPHQYIQCSSLKLNKGHTFRPHKHIWKLHYHKKTIAQESWVVIRGSVEVSFFDIDGELLESVVLCAGDVSFTLQGGHTYEILEDDTFVYEFKTGPYQGQEKDKVFFDDK